MSVLSSTLNQFDGRVIDSESLPADPAEFGSDLRESIELWRREGVRVVWLSIPIRLSLLVPVAAEEGFRYHHAERDTVQMTRVLVEGSYVPPFATHYIGAGGVVIDRERRLLVVSERYRSGRPAYFKLPGGALKPGEHISHAVRREVLEETGIDTEFESLVCFRHWHGYRYGKSDIYFVCRLRPLTFEIVREAEEIDECLWMPVDEYLSHPNVHTFNRRIVAAALEHDGIPHRSIDGYGAAETHELFIP